MNQLGDEGEIELDKTLSLLATVIATVDMPDHQVLAGDIGTVVEVYAEPSRAYEVEFVNPDGTTRALLTLAPNQVRTLSETDVITTRPLAVAA